MNRRDFVRAFVQTSTALAAAHALPALATASPGAAFGPADFDAAVLKHPSLTPFKGVSDATQDLQCASLAMTGVWPAALRGRFYRNGPALFERGGQRYEHWFDGDGMVQQFSFNGSHVSHRGRLVRTPKLLAEQKAGKFLYSAFGTDIQSDATHPPAQGPDSFNTANTSVIEHAGHVLAMWEGGSAFELSAQDLSTKGAVTWKAGLEQVPFSAHPKVDASGHLWNIGTFGKRLIVWHIDPQGQLVDAQLGESPYPNGMVHDMAVTAQYIVVPLPPNRFNFGADGPEKAFEFQRSEPLRILVMRKDDITERRVFELPAQFMFHVGNAHERADGSVALSYVAGPDAGFLTGTAVNLVRGQPSSAGKPSTHLAALNMRTGRATVTDLQDEIEFPRIDPRRVGQSARHLLSGANWLRYAGREGSFHGIQLRDVDSGKLQRFDYGEHMVVEEHIVVPKPGSTQELDAWLVGTSFDVKRQLTVVNVLEASRIADGPIAQATLPYKLPLGFHGNFTAA